MAKLALIGAITGKIRQECRELGESIARNTFRAEIGG